MTETIQRRRFQSVWRMRGSCPAKEFLPLAGRNFPYKHRQPRESAKEGKPYRAKEAKQKREGKGRRDSIPGSPGLTHGWGFDLSPAILVFTPRHLRI
jgi:hypothetical protein